LSFSPLLTQFAFTRPELLANPFVTQPAWEARAYDALGVLLAQAGGIHLQLHQRAGATVHLARARPSPASNSSLAARSLTTFAALVMDDFILTTSSNLPPSVVLTNPLPGQIFTAPALIAWRPRRSQPRARWPT
jgi:hypothetical protein